MDFSREKGGRQDSSSAFGFAPYSPVPSLLPELLPSLLMKLCKGFHDLLEICWEAYDYCLFFLPVLGVGVLWGRQESLSCLALALQGWFAVDARYEEPNRSRGGVFP